MNYLALFLHGNLQSWGAPSAAKPNSGAPRNTASEPTVAGLYGLINSALGVARQETPPYAVEEFRFLVRSDSVGLQTVDYQIAQRKHHGYSNVGAYTTKELPKNFLQDSAYVVLVGHNDINVINRLASTLSSPAFAPFLGRRAHVPSLPVLLGKVNLENYDQDPVRALLNVPIYWGVGETDLTRNVQILDSKSAHVSEGVTSHETRKQGYPLSHDIRDRAYGEYNVRQYTPIFTRSKVMKNTSVAEWERLQDAFCGQPKMEAEKLIAEVDNSLKSLLHF